jgi:DNA-directed RNA polymerase subunit M/transcription elongation factor TFIIS
MVAMFKCPKCASFMKLKGKYIEAEQFDREKIIYQCSKCKNVELTWKPYTSALRMTYP